MKPNDFGFGLSPLTRGTPHRTSTPPLKNRFIPARAGNTRRFFLSPPKSPVYPRLRGEHHIHGDDTLLPFGLSPLARGTLFVLPRDLRQLRFIPARAGNTAMRGRRRFGAAVYPRSRGEHLWMTGAHPEIIGLSPLARGTLARVFHSGLVSRFIPARAGNTEHHSHNDFALAVYPRSRGEHREITLNEMQNPGLSPLARGTLTWRRYSVEICRFIPARAGNTPVSSASPPESPVYPRSRGEHSKATSLYLLHFFGSQHPTNV